MNDQTPMKKMDYLHTIDLVVLRYCGKVKELQVLLQKRAHEPYEGLYALPGLVLNGDQRDASMEAGLERLVRSSKVGIPLRYIEQVGTVGSAVRDPRCWSSSTFYLAIASADCEIGPDHQFVSLEALKSSKLPFDHSEIVEKVVERLYSKSLYTSLPLLLLGVEFSAPEATSVFSVVLNREVLKSSMRQRLSKMTEEGFIAETGRQKAGESARPQYVLENLRPGEIFYFDRSMA